MAASFQTPQGSISYEDSGETDSSATKPVLICIPGIGDLRTQYRYLAPLLAKDAFRVISIDLRGLGESKGEWNEFAADNVGSDIKELVMNHLKMNAARGVILFVSSMAAAACVWVAAELPNIVKGIVFFGPFVRDVPQSIFTSCLLRVLFVSMWGRGVWASFYKTLYKNNPPKDLEEHVKTIHKNICEPGRFEALYGSLFASKAKAQARIQEITVPTLVVMGTLDPDFSKPEDEVDWIRKNFPANTVSSVSVNGAGHYPHVEYPDLCHKEIQHWIAQSVKL